MRGEDLPWLAGFRAFESEITGFSDFAREMGEWGITFDQRGDLLFRGRLLGRWAFSEDDALLPRPTCPLVGPRLGAIALEVYDFTEAENRRELFCGLLKVGRDGMAHRPTGRAWSAVTLQRRTLWWEKVSLDDGAELLTRNEGEYAVWTVETARAACDRAGVAIHPFWLPTCHNTLRTYDEEVRGDVPVDLWLFDFAVLDAIEAVFATGP
jgi:hypothetical protein